MSTKEQSSRREEGMQLARAAVSAASERKDYDMVLLDVSGKCSYTDFILIVAVESDRQVDAVADRIRRACVEVGGHALGVEGVGSGGWVLIDFGDLVVHTFREDAKSFYDIEGLWSDAARVDLDGFKAPLDDSRPRSSSDQLAVTD
ncbi:MAG: ribosome silencing factor [Deltaproteobacteria bacterium]|nr:ribosome silencing factor [Deltaproteobacteria bacterium]